MKTRLYILLPLLLISTIPTSSRAQNRPSNPVALPEPVVPPPIVPPVADELKKTVERMDAAPAPAAAAPAAPGTASVSKDGLLLNFKNAELSDVVNRLSEVAGFVIVGEIPKGTVNIVSLQPVTPEDALDILNAVLLEKGRVVIRNGRILKIVDRKGAEKLDLPVQMWKTRDPEEIPRKDTMVTQILPLRYGDATKLVTNLEPLLSSTATISANESSNSLILTDTLTNIRRVAEIVAAVDTSVEGIATIKVYPLRYADAKELATVVTQLFTQSTASSSSRGRDRGRGGFPGFGSDRGGGGESSGGDSEARKASARVVAVADEQSNSLVVSAPKDVIPDIDKTVQELDTSVTATTDSHVFELQHADATELAGIITDLFASTDSTTANRSGGSREDRMRAFFGGGDRGGNSSNADSKRSLQEAKVVAVGDPRTNQLLVTAATGTMTEIALIVGKLDSSNAKRQKVFMHSLEHADAESVAAVLRGMMGETTTGAAGQTGTNRLLERSSTGATMDTTDFSASGGGRAGGR